jgi:hypothetical protein
MVPGLRGWPDPSAWEEPPGSRVGGSVHVLPVAGQVREHGGERLGNWGRRIAEPDEHLLVGLDDVVDARPEHIGRQRHPPETREPDTMAENWHNTISKQLGLHPESSRLRRVR